ncbi:serine hydrolase [Lactobacillus sp. PV037]|uniref:serine hydrolase n=1 Tax=unclassified Lactobacillus TaxID=2620435 RepID=UPI0022400ED0|nr:MULTISPECIES: serine hydrolase [unclassified Lactobacillus]QNQ82722.1 serine hydrolase [Lactobacillus sp. PV012]QNQ83159.1 serine hydrolase [Lactobacillus sp. PV037]
MKNKVFFISALVAFCSLAFYLVSINHLNKQEVQVYQGQSTKIVKKSSQSSQTSSGTSSTQTSKKVAKKTSSSATNVKIAKGSTQKIAQEIKKTLANQSQPYQVSYVDLNTGKYAQVTNTNQTALPLKSSLRFYVLLAYQSAVKNNKLHSASSYKIKKSDQVGKTDPMLKTGINYSYAYIRDMMVRHDSTTAAMILVNKLGLHNINAVAKKFGAENTTVEKVDNKLEGSSSAADFTTVIKNLYQGKVLGVTHDTQIIGYMFNDTNKGLSSQISGTSYKMSGSFGSVALVETRGKNYVMAVINEKEGYNFGDLGKSINQVVHK